ncbi:hypothetical protein ACHWQZ_G009425 [Mnemiopsis leidyi]
MVISLLTTLSETQQKLAVSSTSLYLRGKINHAVFSSVVQEISLESGKNLNEKDLTVFFIKHSKNPETLDRDLSLSLICPLQLKELIIKELSTLTLSLPPRGLLLDSEFIVGVRSKGEPLCHNGHDNE